MIKAVVIGAGGRMGRRILSLLHGDDKFVIHGAVEHPEYPDIGRDVGMLLGVGELGVRVSANLSEASHRASVLIDFSVRGKTISNGRTAAENGIPLVIGTTGLNPSEIAELREIVRPIPCVMAPNMSVGVNLLFKLAREAVKIAGNGYDVEITEFHHRYKKDAPSGTANRLAEIIAEVLGRDLSTAGVYGRKGAPGERTPTEIGIHALRGGDVVGDHTVFLTTLGERLELTHRAHSRDAFAQGALRAAQFVVTASPGFYDMQDVLGIK